MKRTTRGPKIAVKKLILFRENLRVLRIVDLQIATGGFSGDDSCFPAGCNIDLSLPC